MSIDDVIKILADMAVEETNEDRHTALNAGIAALVFMKGSNERNSKRNDDAPRRAGH